MIYRFFHLNPENVHDRNAYYLVVELFWASILGSAATFNAAFALRLGATNADIGLLSSLPALLAVLISIPAGRILSSKTQRKPWILWPLFFNRLGYLLVALVPWLNMLHIPLGSLTVAIFVLIGIPAHFFNVGWMPLLADVVPERKRAGLVTARMMINNATVSLFNFLFGQALSHILFPYNYVALYLVGFLASMISMICLLKIQVPESRPVPPRPAAPREPGVSAIGTLKLKIWGAPALLRQTIHDYPGLARMIMNTVLHGLGLWLASPLYILYYVRTLGASDAWIGLQGTLSTLAMIIATPFWRRIMQKWGKPNTLKYTIILMGLLPVGVSLLPDLTLILVVIAIYSLVAPAVNLSHFTTLLDVTPEENRPIFTSWYISVVNIAAFVSPMIGVVIADWIGLRVTLFLCGLLSCLGSCSFWVWPVQKAENPLPEEAAAA